MWKRVRRGRWEGGGKRKHFTPVVMLYGHVLRGPTRVSRHTKPSWGFGAPVHDLFTAFASRTQRFYFFILFLSIYFVARETNRLSINNNKMRHRRIFQQHRRRRMRKSSSIGIDLEANDYLLMLLLQRPLSFACTSSLRFDIPHQTRFLHFCFFFSSSSPNLCAYGTLDDLSPHFHTFSHRSVTASRPLERVSPATYQSLDRGTFWFPGYRLTCGNFILSIEF